MSQVSAIQHSRSLRQKKITPLLSALLKQQVSEGFYDDNNHSLEYVPQTEAGRLLYEDAIKELALA